MAPNHSSMWLPTQVVCVSAMMIDSAISSIFTKLSLNEFSACTTSTKTMEIQFRRGRWGA